jgi:hypothetical protein
MSDGATERPAVTDSVADGDIPSELFQVTVTGAGVELTRTVDQATAVNIIAIAIGGAVAKPSYSYSMTIPLSPSAGTPHGQGADEAGNDDQLDSRITIGEYLDECNATKFPEKITAIGSFLELKLGQQSFTRDEVKSQFRPAGEALPGNYSRDFNDAIAQRWIAEDANEKGQYFVTKTGKAAITAKFDRSIRRATATRRRRPTAKPESTDSSSADDADVLDLEDE